MKIYIIYCECSEGVVAVGMTLNKVKAIKFKEQRIKETEYPYWIDYVDVNDEEITLFD